MPVFNNSRPIKKSLNSFIVRVRLVEVMDATGLDECNQHYLIHMYAASWPRFYNRSFTQLVAVVGFD